MTPVFRAWRIGRVLLRYRLDDLLDGTPAERWVKVNPEAYQALAQRHKAGIALFG